jgi:molybdate transport system ATP-binding protein
MDQTASLNVRVTSRFPSGFVVAPLLDARLTAGSLLVLFGPSGAGKTTILRQIAGLETPDMGRLAFNDEVWCDVERGVWIPPQRRRLGLVLQEPALFPHLTVPENVGYGVRHGAAYVEETVSVLGIEGLRNRPPGKLSGGEARRVAIARALAPGPRLVLLDEPLAALDAPTRHRLRQDIRALLRRTSTPGVLVTHDRAEAMAMGDQLAVVINGRIRQVGPVPDVFSHPADAEVAAALGIEAVLPARILESSNGLTTVAIGGTTLVAAERETIPVGSDVFACIRAEDVTLEVRANADTPPASARNHLAARVAFIQSEGAIERVSLDCGFAIDAIITRQSREELGLVPGSNVMAAIKATSIHLVARGG